MVSSTQFVAADDPAATAGKAILGSLVRGGLKIVGTVLVTHGILTQGQADTFAPAVAQEAVGAILVGGSQAWGIVRAWWAHTRWAAAVGQLKTAGLLEEMAAGQAAMLAGKPPV